jgi:hypothetical protein
VESQTRNERSSRKGSDDCALCCESWTENKKFLFEKVLSLEKSDGDIRDSNRGRDTKIDQVCERIRKAEENIAVLMVKAGVWGVIGGAISIIMMVFINYFFKKP